MLKVLNSFLKNLAIKKYQVIPSTTKNSNIFQCVNICKKTSGCKIVNFDSKRHLCQLTDANYEDAVEVDSWEVYIKADEVS